VGEAEGWAEEGGVGPAEPATSMRQAFVLELNWCAVETAGALESSEMLEAVMVQYGPYEYSDSEVLKLTEYLKNCARRGEVVHYDDAYVAVRPFGEYHGPHDQRLWHLLGLISETEIKAKRHALSAIVVIKSGDGANRPGSGFFELEKSFGRYKADDDETWMEEMKGLFAYWANH
jgi:hypothetical protein